MGDGRWRQLYESDLLSVYGLLLLPCAFLLHLALSPRARARPAAGGDARFVTLYALGFGVATCLDPLATGPLLRRLAPGGPAATAVPLLFVLLGDFRVFLLAFHLSDPARRLGRSAALAAAWTPAVALSGWGAFQGLRAVSPALPDQALWLCHELAFLALALVLRGRVLPRRCAQGPLREFLRAALLYAIGYYALWAAADALILGAGLDAGWLLRALPNQLYYGLWVPFVYFAFFRPSAGRLGRDPRLAPQAPAAKQGRAQ
jgi:hypothetical protein